MNTPTPRTDRLAELDITTDGTWIAHARQLERELAAERARLDWLEKRGPWLSWFQHASERSILLRAPIRDAIDATMKEDAE